MHKGIILKIPIANHQPETQMQPLYKICKRFGFQKFWT